jgi:copper chaperone
MGIYLLQGEISMKQIAKLSIEGMHCGACVMRVKNALAAVAGVEVEGVEVGAATVALDASVPAGTVLAAVEAIGFPARVVA